MLTKLLLLCFLSLAHGNQPSADTVNSFKSVNSIEPGYDLDLLEFSEGGLKSSSGFLDIANALPYSVSSVTSGNGRLSRGTDASGQTFLVIRDEDFNIRRVLLRLANGSITSFRLVEGSFFAEVPQEAFRTLPGGDIKNDYKVIPGDNRQRRSLREEHRTLQSSCTSFRTIEVAIAFDSTFCDEYGSGVKSTAEIKVEDVLAEASLHYEKPGLCIELDLVYIDGYCEQGSDPYYALYQDGNTETGCGSDGMLDAFGDFWESNRSHIHRDVAHLFQGRDFTDVSAGCAWLRALCSRSYGYGVNALGWAWDDTLMASMFSHELGHNCGADHKSDLFDRYEYVMETPVNFASDSFSSSSSSTMLNWVTSSASCVTSSTAPPPVSPPVSPPISSPVSQPTPTPPVSAPVPRPTPPPIQGETPSPPSSCLSGENVVEVQGRGSIFMKEVKVGDYVQNRNGEFVRIYSFAHKDEEAELSYRQIYTIGAAGVLEISDEHYVFSNGAFVMASTVQPGDVLLTNQGTESTVSSVSSVTRKGLYAPFTESGELVVSGFVVSNYVKFFESTVIDEHTLIHWFVSPIRSFCKMNHNFCDNETHTRGISNLFLPVAKFAWFVGSLHQWFHVLASLVALPLILIFSVFERAVNASMV